MPDTDFSPDKCSSNPHGIPTIIFAGDAMTFEDFWHFAGDGDNSGDEVADDAREDLEFVVAKFAEAKKESL